MTILGASGVAFGAFCIWLAVRIINRREQWAIGVAIIIATCVVMSGTAHFAYHFALKAGA